MKNNYTIHIPTPCHENWDAMTPVQQGRFCQSCAKEVVDFSMMTDQEVLNYFSKSTGNTCGRFNNDQLQRPLQTTKSEKKKTWWVVAMMPLMLLFEKAVAQKKNNRVVQPGIISQGAIGDTIMILGKVLQPQIKVAHTINGRIIDPQGKPVRYATIKVNNRYTTSADSAGRFSLSASLTDGDNTIEVGCVGYKTETVTINDSTDNYEIVLQEIVKNLEPVVVISYPGTHCYNLTMGTVVIGRKVTKNLKDSFFIKPFIPAAFAVYPNPTPRGSNVTIAFKNEGEYSIQLFDNGGKLITIANYNAAKASLQTILAIPSSLTAGVYYIRLLNAKNKKQYTSKLIVM